MEILQTIQDITKNRKKFKTWEQEQKDREARRKVLNQRTTLSREELERAKSLGRTIIDSVNISDDYSETKARDMEVATEAAMGLVMIPLASVPSLLAMKVGDARLKTALNIGGAAAALAGSISLISWATDKQKEASRIARFQAREKELKDPRSFVVYTPEQLQQAREIAKDIPDEPEKKDFMKGKIPFKQEIETLLSLEKDKKAYKEWFKEHKESEQSELMQKKTNLSPETLKKAKQDQDIITRVVKKINLKAEEYSENTETAVETVSALAGLEILVAAPAGWALADILQKKLKLIPQKVSPKLVKVIGGAVAGIMLPVITVAASSKYVKEATKIGRFKAKQELMSDPHNFIHYDEEQMAGVSDIKAPKEKKGPFQSIVDNAKFFFQLIKDGKEYNKYKKTEEKQEEKLRKALQKIDVSDNQLKEAGNLQEKVFNVFEKSDEMWQRYSEDTEGAIKIGQQIMGYIPMALGLVAAGAGWVAHKAGLLTNENLEKVIAQGNRVAQAVEPITKPITKLIQPITQIGFVKKHPKVALVAAIGVPVLGVLAGGAFALQSYFTKLQKDAGRIGFMKAMEELKDPVYFVDKDPVTTSIPAINPQASQETLVTSLMRERTQSIT